MKRIRAAAVAVAMLSAAAARAQIVPTTLHSFDGTDGQDPVAALVDGGDGRLYGTTSLGGASGDGVVNPAGTIFAIAPDGDFETLYTFEFQVTGDRSFAPVLFSGGSIFGTNRGSGSFNGNVFRLDGGFTSLHTFTGYFVGADGGHPEAALVDGGDGSLYGTTSDGGASNVGTIYRISGDDYELLHSFSGSVGPKDGGSPRAALVRGGDGALYGTTSAGGPTQPAAYGTVFRFVPGTPGVTTLHTFRGVADGEGPNATLVKIPGGDLYGTTGSGGAFSAGTLFRISEGGDFESLHAFGGVAGTARYPVGLTLGSDGNLYGAAASGGANFIGAIFGIRPDGADYEDLASFGFTGGAGNTPQSPPTQLGDGNFYGTAKLGGAYGKGVVYGIDRDDLFLPEPGATSLSAAALLGLAVLRSRRDSRARRAPAPSAPAPRTP